MQIPHVEGIAPPNIRLKGALFAAGVPQYVIAQDCGMTETRLSRIVCGRAAASELEQRRIAGRLGVDAAELFPSSSVAEGTRS